MNDTRLPDPSRRLTGRLAAVIVTAVVMVASGLVLQAPADAERARCPDGSYPPCDGDEPPETTTPEPTTTTRPAPPPPSVWQANAEILNKSGTPLGPVVAHRWFVPHRPIIEPGGDPDDPPVPADDPLPAGSAPLLYGAFTFAPVTQPPGKDVQLLVGEGGGRGLLCRTPPRAWLPATGRVIRIIVAPPQVTGPNELNAMVSDITGELARETDTAGTVQTVTATSATLVPQADGLLLTLGGTLDVNFSNPATVDWRIGFTFRQRLTLKGSQGFNVGESLVVDLAGEGSVDLTWVAGEPATGGDDLLDFIATLLVPRMRTGVLAKAGPLINPKVAQLHAVRWWTEQGFTLSIRNVSYSTDGLNVEATFCRLG